MGKRTLRKSDIKELMVAFPELGITKKNSVEEENNLLFVDGKPFFFYFDKRVVPHLKVLLEHPHLLPCMVVDIPAVKHLVNGADVMRPGIVKVDSSVAKGDLVVVKDEKYSKPICICIALFDGPELQRMEKGKVLQNIHYVGDDIWKI